MQNRLRSNVFEGSAGESSSAYCSHCGHALDGRSDVVGHRRGGCERPLLLHADPCGAGAIRSLPGRSSSRGTRRWRWRRAPGRSRIQLSPMVTEPGGGVNVQIEQRMTSVTTESIQPAIRPVLRLVGLPRRPSRSTARNRSSGAWHANSATTRPHRSAACNPPRTGTNFGSAAAVVVLFGGPRTDRRSGLHTDTHLRGVAARVSACDGKGSEGRDRGVPRAGLNYAQPVNEAAKMAHIWMVAVRHEPT
jgi:hypothetical protein